MSDLISKSELIEAIKQRMKLHEKDTETLATKEAFYDDEELFLRLADECQAIIELVEKQKTDDKWIPCKKELPKCNGCYLVFRPHFFGGEIGVPTVCYFDGQDTWHDSYGVNFEKILNKEDVVAWMPLPEDYKGE